MLLLSGGLWLSRSPWKDQSFPSFLLEVVDWCGINWKRGTEIIYLISENWYCLLVQVHLSFNFCRAHILLAMSYSHVQLFSFLVQNKKFSWMGNQGWFFMSPLNWALELVECWYLFHSSLLSSCLIFIKDMMLHHPWILPMLVQGMACRAMPFAHACHYIWTHRDILFRRAWLHAAPSSRRHLDVLLW